MAVPLKAPSTPATCRSNMSKQQATCGIRRSTCKEIEHVQFVSTCRKDEKINVRHVASTCRIRHVASTCCWCGRGFKWHGHVAIVVSKASKRLWFLKKLKRAGVSVDDLVHYHQSVIRPVLEYACAVSLYGTLIKRNLSKTFGGVRYE